MWFRGLCSQSGSIWADAGSEVCVPYAATLLYSTEFEWKAREGLGRYYDVCDLLRGMKVNTKQ